MRTPSEIDNGADRLDNYKLYARDGAGYAAERKGRPTACNVCSGSWLFQNVSRQWLASNISGALDLDQDADSSVCANMRLLARQQHIENGVANRAALVQFGLAIKSQKARVENTIALCFEIGIDHTHALIMTEVVQGLFL